MVAKIRIKNYIILKNQYKSLKGKQKEHVFELIEQYKNGSPYNINTLRYDINNYLTSKSNQKQDIKYYQSMVKYLTSTNKRQAAKQQKLTEKYENLVKQIDKKIKPKQKKSKYLIDIYFFSRVPRHENQRHDFIKK